MKITVAGTGYVGLVAAVCFAHVGHDVICYDVDESKINMLKAGVPTLYEAGLEELMAEGAKNGKLVYTTDAHEAYADADAIFIAVGTPEQPDGSADLTYVAAVARQIAETVERDCLVVVKSTVPIGTNDKIEQHIHDLLVNDVKILVASNPEFLAQGTAVENTLRAQRIVIGTNEPEAERKLYEIYEPFGLPIVSVSRRSAEMIKYACNDFLALKISYMNEIANLCELVGANVEDVAAAMKYDRRIGDKFLNAGTGYGGSCFPKDTKALRYIARQHGMTLKTIEAAVEVNTEQKTVLFRKASKRMITFSHMKAAVLGATFKPETDDLREAPALDIIELLLKHGAEVYVYDPVGLDNLKKKFGDRIHICTDCGQALAGANICFIMTEWNQIKAVAPGEYKRLMRTPLVYDGRNIYSPDDMKKAGVEYYSVGR